MPKHCVPYQAAHSRLSCHAECFLGERKRFASDIKRPGKLNLCSLSGASRGGLHKFYSSRPPPSQHPAHAATAQQVAPQPFVALPAMRPSSCAQQSAPLHAMLPSAPRPQQSRPNLPASGSSRSCHGCWARRLHEEHASNPDAKAADIPEHMRAPWGGHQGARNCGNRRFVDNLGPVGAELLQEIKRGAVNTSKSKSRG